MDSVFDRVINLEMSSHPRSDLEKHSQRQDISVIALVSEDQNLSDQEGNDSTPSSAFLNEKSQALKTQCLIKALCAFYPISQYLTSTYLIVCKDISLFFFIVPRSEEYIFKFVSALSSRHCASI